MTDFYEQAKHVFEQQIPFNRFLGLKVRELGDGRARLRFEMQDELVGNFVHGSLHGGVVSAAIDATGGLVAYASQFEQAADAPGSATEMLARTGTVDLRIDYLLPGKGSSFEITGAVLRKGRRLLVARMDLLNDEGTRIATGTGVYSLG